MRRKRADQGKEFGFVHDFALATRAVIRHSQVLLLSVFCLRIDGANAWTRSENLLRNGVKYVSSEANHEIERLRTTYEIYVRLHAARASYPKMALRTVISELMYAEPFAWRAVGITIAALTAYHQAGRNKVQGIERAHLTDRFKMVQHILDRAEPLSHQDLFSYWHETDRVVIALRSENRSNSLGAWIPFDNDQGQLFPRLGMGFNFRHGFEGELIHKLTEQILGESAKPGLL